MEYIYCQDLEWVLTYFSPCATFRHREIFPFFFFMDLPAILFEQGDTETYLVQVDPDTREWLASADFVKLYPQAAIEFWLLYRSPVDSSKKKMAEKKESHW